MRHQVKPFAFIQAAIFTIVALAGLLTQSARAQVPPQDDDDGSIVTLIAALIPVCKVPVVTSPTTPISQSDAVTLTATCSNNPTSYEWSLNGTVIAGQTGNVLKTTAPSNVGAAVYSVVASFGGLKSAPVSVSVNVASATPACSNFFLEQQPASDLNAYLLRVFCTKSPNYYYFFVGPTWTDAYNQTNGGRFLNSGRAPGQDVQTVANGDSLVPGPNTFARLYPGTYKFWMRSLGTNNEFSDPISFTATVGLTFAGATVDFIAPVNNAFIAAGNNQNLQVTLSGGNIQISRIEFYRQDLNGRNEVKLGEVAVNALSGTYQFLWTNVPLGTYNLHAKAFSTNGTASNEGVPNFV